MMTRINRMEQRPSSITKKQQIVSQKMKRVLPSLVRRGLEVLERDMVTKLGGLENRLAKELVTSQSREAIGWQWPWV